MFWVWSGSLCTYIFIIKGPEHWKDGQCTFSCASGYEVGDSCYLNVFGNIKIHEVAAKFHLVTFQTSDT